jgi:Phosphotransferase enzyme family
MAKPLYARWGPPELLDTDLSASKPAKASEALAKAFLKGLFHDGDPRLPALAMHASTLYGGRFCSVNKRLVARGGYHVLLRLEFDDGVVWAARICLPSMVESHVASLNMESEVATLLYLKRKVSFRVPDVYGYNYHASNSVGSPYAFLEIIEGETLYWRMQDVKMREDHRQWVITQVAQFLGELSKLHFTKIGQLRLGDDLPPHLGKIVPRWYNSEEHGPFNTASEYYSSRARLRLDIAKTRLSETEIDGIKRVSSWKDMNEFERAVLIAWLHVQAVPLAVIPELDKGPFLLQHADLHVTNIITDDDFNIVGFLDWTWACAVPPQSFTVFHEPHESRLDFLWPSNMVGGEARDKEQLIDNIKRFEDPTTLISKHWVGREAAIARCLDCPPGQAFSLAPRLSMMVYEGDEESAFSQLVQSFSTAMASS